MAVQAKQFLHVVAVLLVLAVSTACTDEKQGAAVTEPAAVGSQAVPIVIEEIVVGKADSAPGTPEPLTPEDDIRVVLKTNASSKTGELEVKLFDIGNGKQVDIRNERITSDNAGATELIFKHNGGWAPGRYMLELKIDGQLAGQRDFDVIALPPSSPQKAP